MTTATATQITHWIAGAPDDGSAQRFGEVT